MSSKSLRAVMHILYIAELLEDTDRSVPLGVRKFLAAAIRKRFNRQTDSIDEGVGLFGAWLSQFENMERDATLRELASGTTGSVTKKLTELRKLNDAARGLSDRHLRRVIKPE